MEAISEQTLHRFAVTPGVGRVFFTPEQMRMIGEVAGPSGRVEINAFMQLIVHTPAENLEEQHRKLREAGLAIYPVGRVVKNLHTCTFCMGEKVDGLPDARRLDEVVAGRPTPFPVRIGFSGCASNCGEALVRDIGVVRMDADRYDIFIGGRPGGLNPSLGRKVAEHVSSEALPRVVAALLDTYRQTARGKERLWKNIGRVGLQPYQAAAEAAQKGAPS